MQHTMGAPLASAGFARSSGAATAAAAPACTTWRRPVSMDIMGENAAAVPARARTSALRCMIGTIINESQIFSCYFFFAGNTPRNDQEFDATGSGARTRPLVNSLDWALPA